MAKFLLIHIVFCVVIFIAIIVDKKQIESKALERDVKETEDKLQQNRYKLIFLIVYFVGIGILGAAFINMIVETPFFLTGKKSDTEKAMEAVRLLWK